MSFLSSSSKSSSGGSMGHSVATVLLLRLTATVLLQLLLMAVPVQSQFCTNTCPPRNDAGVEIPSLCEGDAAESFADVTKQYAVCHPTASSLLAAGATTTSSSSIPSSFSFQDFAGPGRITVIANFYIGCNAGRRESGVFAHVAQKYYNQYQDRTMFVTSLKGGTSCAQWANIYQEDALRLFPTDTDITPVEMPLAVQDQEYEIRDDFFTTPFGHPSYVILDGDLKVRHKFIGPCCGYESYFDCTADIARSLDDTLSGYLDTMLRETDAIYEPNMGGSGDVFAATTPAPTPLPTVAPECVVGDFSEWSECSLQCGASTVSAIQFRWRMVQGGDGCTAITPPVETRACTAPQETCGDERTGCVEEWGATYTIETVATGFDGPRDVAFHPTPGLHLGSYQEGRPFYPDAGEEVWVINALNHSVSIVASLGDNGKQTTISRRDRGYYHYMANATALAFNAVGDSTRSVSRDSFNYWAVCNDNLNTYLDTKEPNNFMGPTLYNSDPRNRNLVNRLGEECQVDEECYFLHADMLHESPACIGIAHDPERATAYGTVYWAFDATGNQQNGQLVRFDFQQPHGPGSMDHSVAAVRRFPQVKLNRGPVLGIHAGMVVHPESRELFIAEPGANRVVVVHADSGTFARTAREEYPIFSNQLPSFEYSIFECPEQRVFATNVDTPTGVALSQDGTKLFVAERGSGDVLVYEIASAALLTRIKTGFATLSGMAVSPKTGALYFVDEDSNTLNTVKPTSQCATPFTSRLSASFSLSIGEALAQVGVNSFSLYRDYECVADPIVPDAAFFEQVHDDSGYASDNPDVQSMAGMDESAALLANRTDCGRTSDLNFDALLLGGYFCHTCLPGSQGAECEAGGACRNVQWNGFVCDNEYIVSHSPSGDELVLMTPEGVRLKASDIALVRGVTYRFTVRDDDRVCLFRTDDSGSLIAVGVKGNESGCARRGPLILEISDDFPEILILQSEQGDALLMRVVDEPISLAEAGDGNKGVVIGAAVGAAIFAVVVVAVGIIWHRRRATKALSSSNTPDIVKGWTSSTDGSDVERTESLQY